MKTINLLVLLSALAGSVAAASFQNLGFDDANTNNIRDDGLPPGQLVGPAFEMLPGWSLSFGTNVETRVGYNLIVTGGGIATLFDSRNSSGYPTFSQYFLALYPPPDQYQLSQAGEIPADAKSIRFIVYSGGIGLKVNGIPIPVTFDTPLFPPPPSEAGFRKFGNGAADISGFAGQTVELQFSNIDGFTPTGLDSIFFSPVPIPEPSSLVLFSLGGVILAVCLRRR